MNRQSIVVNILAAFTVSIVTLSLGAAFGLMSGRGALAGMISAAILSVVTSFLGGTKVQCSGPTAPVTTLLVGLLASQTDLSMTGVSKEQFLNIVFLFGGLCMLFMGLFNLGKYISLIPNVVISGFATGIGLLIFRSQFVELWSSAGDTVFVWIAVWVLGAFIIAMATPYILQKVSHTWSRFLSGTLIALVLGTLLANVFQIPIDRISIGDPNMGIVESLPFISFDAFYSLTQAGFLLALIWAVQLGVTMYLDTLITSVIMDRLTKTKSNKRKELMAQGLGGMIVGCVGGIPGAQATERSVLLFKEGACQRWAGGLVGFFCVLLIVLFQGVLGLIPQAIFMGILMKVAFDIIDFKPLRLYVKELKDDHVWQDFFSRHNDEPIFVTNIEIMFIVGTAVSTLIFGLIPSVFFFTFLYWFLNRVVWPDRPLRDLEVGTETSLIQGED